MEVGVLRMRREDLGVLLIDVQPLFVDLAFPDGGAGLESLLVRLEHLLLFADWMDLPLIATFEKPVESNGELPERLEAVFPAGSPRIVKNYFGSLSEPAIAEELAELRVSQIAVAGAETDVCVLQTVLGLVDGGYQVFLLEDCLFTTEADPGPALRRMYAAGAVPATLKAMMYELVECVDATAWYPEGWVMKGRPGAKPFPAGFKPPEEWPPPESRI